MRRHAFKMQLKPGYAAEYKRRHDELFPEVAQLLHEAGIRDYSIFLDEDTHTLFAYQLVADEVAANAIPQHPAIRKWWDYMADIMETHADNEPIATSLREVFHQD